MKRWKEFQKVRLKSSGVVINVLLVNLKENAIHFEEAAGFICFFFFFKNSFSKPFENDFQQVNWFHFYLAFYLRK